MTSMSGSQAAAANAQAAALLEAALELEQLTAAGNAPSSVASTTAATSTQGTLLSTASPVLDASKPGSPAGGYLDILSQYMQVIVLAAIQIVANNGKVGQLQSQIAGIGVNAMKQAVTDASQQLGKLMAAISQQAHASSWQKILGIIASALLVAIGVITSNPGLVLMGVFMLTMTLSGGQAALNKALSGLGLGNKIMAEIAIDIGVAIATAGIGALLVAPEAVAAGAATAATEAAVDSAAEVSSSVAEDASLSAAEDAVSESVVVEVAGSGAVGSGMAGAAAGVVADGAAEASISAGNIGMEVGSSALGDVVESAAESAAQSAADSIVDEMGAAAGELSVDSSESAAESAANSAVDEMESAASELSPDSTGNIAKNASKTTASIAKGNFLLGLSSSFSVANPWTDIAYAIAKACKAGDKTAQEIGDYTGMAIALVFALAGGYKAGQMLGSVADTTSMAAKLLGTNNTAILLKGLNIVQAGLGVGQGASGIIQGEALRDQAGAVQAVSVDQAQILLFEYIIKAANTQMNNNQQSANQVNSNYQAILNLFASYAKPYLAAAQI